jgi:hypothetical protein
LGEAACPELTDHHRPYIYIIVLYYPMKGVRERKGVRGPTQWKGARGWKVAHLFHTPNQPPSRPACTPNHNLCTALGATCSHTSQHHRSCTPNHLPALRERISHAHPTPPPTADRRCSDSRAQPSPLIRTPKLLFKNSKNDGSLAWTGGGGVSRRGALKNIDANPRLLHAHARQRRSPTPPSTAGQPQVLRYDGTSVPSYPHPFELRSTVALCEDHLLQVGTLGRFRV